MVHSMVLHVKFTTSMVHNAMVNNSSMRKSSAGMVHNVKAARSCPSSSASGSTSGSAGTTAAQMLIGTAPSLLATGPADLEIGQARMAIIRQLHVSASTVYCHPSPIAIHLYVFPHHAEARIHMWRTGAFTSFPLLGATPLFL